MVGRIIGHYRIVEKLGGGGMGVVYKAEDTKLGRTIALKVLPPERVADPNRKRRFVQEARAASALNHPNIITIYDIDEAEGVHFIAMEYVEGKTLDRLIARHGLRVNEALRYAVQMATALAKAHAAGIVHRDLKPTNVMVTDDGLVKVLDFGLAKLTEAAPTGDAETAVTVEPTTEEGTIVGTVGYMSPEQAEGKPVDARSDVFSFGSVLYEMLTGQRAFQGETKASTIAAILREEPKPLSQVVEGLPREVERIVKRCLRKDPAHRVQHMDDLKVALEELKEESDSGELAATARAEKKRLSRTALAAIAVATVALLAVAAVVAYILWPRPQAPAQRTLTRLTFDPGLQSNPTFSPDGQFIAYSSDRSGNFDIWVQQISGGNPVQVTNNPAHDWQPDWSPDGKQIVLRSERDGGGLFVVPALGGSERKVSSFGYRPRWSPDGSQILFSSSLLQSVSEPPRLFMVGLDGNPPQSVLAERLTEFKWVRSVAWYPDGQRVSFEGWHRGVGAGFWTVPLGEGKPVKLRFTPELEKQFDTTRLTSNAYLWGPSRRTLYLEAVVRGVRNLWKVTVDPQTFRVVAPAERLTTGPGPDTETALSKDGKGLAFTTRLERTRIWSLPFDAARGKILGEAKPISAAGVDASHPALSLDGKKLAFVAHRADKWELWEKSLTDGRETLLAAGESRRRGPRWSRDGTRLVYDRYDPNGQEWAVVLPSGGGIEQPLTTPASYETSPAPTDWSPDGRWILGVCVQGKPTRMVVCLLPLSAAPHAEAQARVLVASHPKYNFWQGNYSPDGRWIAVNAEDKTGVGISTIGVLPASGGEWTPISEGKYWDDTPRWSPDGKTIYFLSSRSGFMNVWGIRFNPANGEPVGEPFRVTSFESPAQMVQGLQEISVAQDRLVVPVAEVTGNIWMLENVER
jgi:Tol biopolymer transport system component/predicted Ser/Thr protein kinase